MLAADVARCPGTDCKVKAYCQRYTEPGVEDHPRQVFFAESPAQQSDDPCMQIIYSLPPGGRGKFFHPETLGVMLPATVVSCSSSASVRVKFDVKGRKGKRVYVVPLEHNPE